MKFLRAVALALLLLSRATAVADTKDLPRAEDVIRKAIERAKWSDAQKFDGKFTYTQRTTVDELDSKEKVKKHEVRLYHVLPIEGEPYARLMEKDGRALAASEQKQEQEREQKFRQRQAERKRKKAEKKDNEDVKFDENLAAKYHFEVTGRETLNGRPALVLTFEPRSKDLPARRKIDRLLNHVAGRVWIDEQDSELVRVDLHLAENVTAWGGLLASVRKFFLRFEQSKVDDTAWLPSFVDGYVDGRILVRSLHLKIRQENSNFRRVTPAAADSSGRK